MNNIVVKKEEKLTNLIYEVRGKQVMLDSDLARIYECANGTKSINLAVKRHINRFPERFMFQLTMDEVNSLPRFQIETLKGQGHNIKYLPYAFTEQGVAMLATVLKTSVAEEMSIKIMDAFVAMRKFISSNLIEQKYINNLVLKHDYQITLLQKSLAQFEEKEPVNEIYFNGQIYDAYSKILDIFKSAKKELIIIDAYADKTLLDIIKEVPNINVTIITKTPSLLSKTTIEKYNKEYHNLVIKYDNTFHDRYFILDNSIVYHCGASINKIGYKTFSITKIGDKEVIAALITQINKVI